MSGRSVEAAARAMRAAPDGPSETTVVHGSWSIQHKKKPGKEHWVTEPPKGDPAWWFTSWAGERHRLDAPEQAAERRRECEHAFDRSYSSDDKWADSRMLLRTETHTVKVERVPAMWDLAPSSRPDVESPSVERGQS